VLGVEIEVCMSSPVLGHDAIEPCNRSVTSAIRLRDDIFHVLGVTRAGIEGERPSFVIVRRQRRGRGFEIRQPNAVWTAGEILCAKHIG